MSGAFEDTESGGLLLRTTNDQTPTNPLPSPTNTYTQTNERIHIHSYTVDRKRYMNTMNLLCTPSSWCGTMINTAVTASNTSAASVSSQSFSLNRTSHPVADLLRLSKEYIAAPLWLGHTRPSIPTYREKRSHRDHPSPSVSCDLLSLCPVSRIWHASTLSSTAIIERKGKGYRIWGLPEV